MGRDLPLWVTNDRGGDDATLGYTAPAVESAD